MCANCTSHLLEDAYSGLVPTGTRTVSIPKGPSDKSRLGETRLLLKGCTSSFPAGCLNADGLRQARKMQVSNKGGEKMAKSWKKALSVALSALMLMSSVAFSGIASAAPATDETFPVGSTMKFDFGTIDQKAVDGYISVEKDDLYEEAKGYGWQSFEGSWGGIYESFAQDEILGDGIKYNNIRNQVSSSVVEYSYPTFTVDLPNGLYDVRIIQGSKLTEYVSGAYLNGNMNAVKWSTEEWADAYTEPSEASWIESKPNEWRDNTVRVAVYDGKLTVELATSLKDDGTSGTGIINAMEITRVEQQAASEQPRIRFIGDSTVATYPPYDQPDLTPIPEQTGWGSEFANRQFFADNVIIDNKGRGGYSARNFISKGDFNRFFVDAKPGDTVMIEWGINETAAGRRYINPNDSALYKEYLMKYVNAVRAFGGTPVLVTPHTGNANFMKYMRELAQEENVLLIDMNPQFAAYKKAVPAASSYLTVDGTHPSRVGGILCAQIITNDLKDLDTPIKPYVKAHPLNTENAPTAVVSNITVARQTTGSVTLTWEMPESVIYHPDQMIVRFPVYRKAAGADASTYEKVGEGTAYVTPDLTAPNLRVTLESPATGDYDYAIAATGLTGTGPMSEPITVRQYVQSPREALENLVDEYGYEQRHAPYHYTLESYVPLAQAGVEAMRVLEDEKASDDILNAALNNMLNAVNGLEHGLGVVISDDMEGEFAANWGTTGQLEITRELEENGNHYLNFYVSASGGRSRTKKFDAVESDKLSLEFDWLPGNPDRRNVTEFRFLGSANSKDPYFTLKTSNNGHIGYVAGYQYADIQSDGFEKGPAVDLGLRNDIWYSIQVVFDYTTHTADLYIESKDVDQYPDEYAYVPDIAIPEDAKDLTSMIWYTARGKNDTGGNDLSTLWSTNVDNFGIYYVPAGTVIDDNSLMEAADAAYEIISQDDFETKYTQESRDALMDAYNLGYFIDFDLSLQADYDYVAEQINLALANLQLDFSKVTVETDKDSYVPNETITVTAVLPGDVVKPYLVSEAGSGLASTRSYQENADGTKTWTLTFALGTKGDRTLKLFADGVDTGKTVAFKVGDPAVNPEDPKPSVISVTGPTDPVKRNEPFTVTIVTNKSAKIVRLFNESNMGLAPISCTSVENADGTITWTCEMSVGSLGNRVFTAKAANYDRVFYGDQTLEVKVR